MKASATAHRWAVALSFLVAGPLCTPDVASAVEARPRAGGDSATSLPALVATLNARYYKTPGSCGADAGGPYLCSGIVESIRFGTLDLKDKHYARDAVSFSYLRADVPTTTLWVLGVSGVIVNHFEGDGSGYDGYSMRARCLFPTDGATDTRPDGCGAVKVDYNPNPAGTSKPCGLQGIQTAEEWAKFHDHRLKEGWRQFGCGFEVTASDFRTAIAGQNLIDVDGAMGEPMRYQWNELILGAWPADAAGRIPVEAFFYMPDNYSNEFVRELQCDYFVKTGRVVPIVRLRLPPRHRPPTGNGAVAAQTTSVFSADMSDQAVTVEHASRAVCDAVLARSGHITLYQGMPQAEIDDVKNQIKDRYRDQPMPERLSTLLRSLP